jgi:hypothetical protein
MHPLSIAFSSEVDTGSREENASDNNQRFIAQGNGFRCEAAHMRRKSNKQIE